MDSVPLHYTTNPGTWTPGKHGLGDTLASVGNVASVPGPGYPAAADHSSGYHLVTHIDTVSSHAYTPR